MGGKKGQANKTFFQSKETKISTQQNTLIFRVCRQKFPSGVSCSPLKNTKIASN